MWFICDSQSTFSQRITDNEYIGDGFPMEDDCVISLYCDYISSCSTSVMCMPIIVV